MPRGMKPTSVSRAFKLKATSIMGLRWFPTSRFRATRETRTAKQPPPELVGFDFASYADRKIFTAHTKLEIRCDDKLIFGGDARLLSPADSASDGSTAQFLT